MAKPWNPTRFCITVFAAVMLAIAAHADRASADPSQQNEWQSSFTPYVWLPTIHGSLNFTVPTGAGGLAGPALALTVTPSQYVPKLDSAFMFTAETHNRNWGVATDLISLNLGVSNAGVTSLTGPFGRITVPINTNMQLRFASTVWTLVGTANVARNSHWNMDALAGGRYFYAPVRVTWNLSGPLGILNAQGSHYQSASVWDAIVGVKGRVDLGDGHWFVPYYADIGTGEAPTTWQGVAGIGYGSKHSSVLLVYRNLFYDQGNQKLIHNLNLGGPTIGYTFKL